MPSSFWASLTVPSVQTVSTWVWPRVNMPEPWTRGSSPTSAASGRISSIPRPSTRFCSSSSQRRTTNFWSLYIASSMTAALDLSSLSNWAWTRSMTGASRSSRTFLLSVSIANFTSSMANALICSKRSWGTSTDSKENLGLPISAWISLMRRTIRLISSWPLMIAWSIVSLSTSLAPASIMQMTSSLAATVRCRSLSARCSALGQTTISPSTRPTLTPAIGPFQGMSEMDSASETPHMPAISGGQSGSTDMTVMTTEQSLRMSLGKSGRMGRSTRRELRIALSEGRASRLMNEPGILPTE